MSLSVSALHEQNRASWNAATTQHRTHKPNLIERYTKGSYHNLCREDMALLLDGASSLAGKRVAHLQCNDGQDTVSIARALRPASVLGVDISDVAIEFAGELRDAMGFPSSSSATIATKANAVQGKDEREEAPAATVVDFVRSDVIDFCATTDQQFDLVYASYGVYCWIADLTRWASGISRILKPNGGRVVFVDFHPVIVALKSSPSDHSFECNALGGDRLDTRGVGDYVGNDHEGAFKNPHRASEFTWGIGDILGAFLAASPTRAVCAAELQDESADAAARGNGALRLLHFREYTHMNRWQCHEDMPLVDPNDPDCREYAQPRGMPKVPMMFSLVAVREQ